MAIPIWKDTYCTIGRTSAQYRVRLLNASGRVIYEGKAYARPGEYSVRIKLNDVCADYIAQALPVVGQTITPLPFSFTFYCEYFNGSAWAVVDTVTFLWDWSYDYDFDADNDELSVPITRRVDPRQYLVASTRSQGTADTLVVTPRTGGRIRTVSVPIRRVTDFAKDRDSVYAIFEQAAAPGTVVKDLTELTEPGTIDVAGWNYTVDYDCHDFCIYYVNAHGGWDSLLLNGRTSEADTYTRHSIGGEYNNGRMAARSGRNYLTEVVKKFTLNTGWLTDESSALMHHLLGSTLTYLHNLATGELIPVQITNSDCPYKTYGGEGNKLVNYTIEAEVVHSRMRK